MQEISDFLEFLDQSPTAYHAVEVVKKRLEEAGFLPLDPGRAWKMTPGDYYIESDGFLLALRWVKGAEGFHIIASHGDSPGFRLKPSGEIHGNDYQSLNMEVYGGPILGSWFDRNLALAGRVWYRQGQNLSHRLVHLHWNVVIPSLAIHMNRQVNDGVSINPQVDCLPLVGESLEEGFLRKQLAKELSLSPEEIVDYDLFLVEEEGAVPAGLQKEYISSGRLDNLAMVYASLQALLAARPTHHHGVMVLYNHEEVGSRTREGASAPRLSNLLERFLLAEKKGREEFFMALSKSFLLSADMAHALHPNHPEKADPTHRPRMNRGPVLKIAANRAYTGDGGSSARCHLWAQKAGVNLQTFTNRSDQRGGSTIGPLALGGLDVEAADVGNAMLSMHSIRELTGRKDQEAMIKFMQSFLED